MLKTFLLMLFYYLCILAVWIFLIVIPYGSRILVHIQNTVNLHSDLNLLYCGKQILYIVLLSIVLSIAAYAFLLAVIQKLLK